jgi:predicted DNA-binding protein
MKHDLNEQIVLRVPSALRDRIETAAEAEGRTLANMTRRILESWALDRQPTTAAPR